MTNLERKRETSDVIEALWGEGFKVETIDVALEVEDDWYVPSNSRKGYEFRKRTKDVALNEAQEEDELEVHHIVPVSVARRKGVSPDLVRSPINAVAMPKKKHREIDHNDPDLDELADELLELQPRLW